MPELFESSLLHNRVTFLEHIATVIRRRSLEGLVAAMGLSLNAVTARNARGLIEHRGYYTVAQLHDEPSSYPGDLSRPM